jgi:anaerobic magnesium-protoporphyrin IX monomethyl ester cyclase
MKRILITHSYFLRFDPKQWAIMQPYAPLGTLYAAAVLREKGYEVKVWDTMFEEDPRSVKEVITAFKAEALVIYDDGFNYLTKMCLTNMREAAFVMSTIASEMNIPVVISSSDASDHYEKYLDNGATVVIRGEGEVTLAEVIKCFSTSTNNFNITDGIVFRKDGKTCLTRSREVIRNPDKLPFPAWDLIDMDHYKQQWLKNHGYFSVNMSTTRGCPFKCNWCAKPIYGNRYNSRSPENVAEEVRLLKENYQADHIWFCDDIFGLKPGWVNRFSEIVNEKKLVTPYKIQSRADLLLQEKYVESLSLSGCETAWMGAESGSQKILDAMDKGTKVEQIYEATSLLKKHNIRPAFFLQFGYPGEENEDISKTIDMLMELMPDDIGISVSYPLPGTLFYERVKQQMVQKSNWTDSDELALMFNNTFPADYYRHLHRYVHKKYRRRQGINIIRHSFKNSFSLNKAVVKRIAGVLYHFPGELYHLREMKKLSELTPKETHTAAAAFNKAANTYDEEFTYTEAGRIQRSLIRNYLHRNISVNAYKNTLELNCGTGEDAIWLAERGHKVIATDISPGMIEIGRRKANASLQHIEFVHASFDKINLLKVDKTDLVFSNFGGLNCVSPAEMKNLSADLHEIMRSGAKFIAVVMGRKTILEKLYFFFKGDFKNMRRRQQKGPVLANVGGHTINTWYYSPNEIKSCFTNFSDFVFTPVGLVVPPSWLNNKFKKVPFLVTACHFIEKITAGFPSFSDYADHYIVEMTRK